jgi:serine/threonine protein kinase
MLASARLRFLAEGIAWARARSVEDHRLPQAEGHPFGKYQLLDRIAAGGMAEIYRARYTGAAGVTKAVVVKKILPHYAGNRNFVSMFINEAKIVVGLSHGNIAQVFDFGEIDGEYFLAMELVDGQPLSRVMHRAKEMGMPVIPIPFAVYIMMETCKGLHYAHTRLDEQGRPLNIIHRDVSPQNILISYEGQLKIVDFGIAKARNAIKVDTEIGAVKGKYVYFAPEQARGKEIDARTDVFAAGTCLYEMLCGRLPFEGKMMEALGKIVRCDFPRPRQVNPEIPLDLERILLLAMEAERADRYPTAQAFQEALSGYLYAHEPTFSAAQLAHLMSYLYESDLVAEGRPVQLPKDFLEQALQWRAPLKAPGRSSGPKAPPRPELPDLDDSGPLEASGPIEVSGALEVSGPISTSEALETSGPLEASGPIDDVIDSRGVELPSMVARIPTRWAFLGAPIVAMLIAALVVLAVGHFGSFSVRLTSSPPGAWVEVDGQRAPGVTPMMISNLAGDRPHLIRVSALGMKPWSKTVSPAHGQTLALDAHLETDGLRAPPPPAPEPATPVSIQPKSAPSPPAPDPAPAPAEGEPHELQLPLTGSARLSPRAHTCLIPRTKSARMGLDPTKTYRIWTEAKLSASQVFFFAEGTPDLGANDRFGLLTGKPQTLRHATALYAFAILSDAARDASWTARVRVHERGERAAQVLMVSAKENAIEPDPDERLRIRGLDPSRHYTLKLRQGNPPARLSSGNFNVVSRVLAAQTLRVLDVDTAYELNGIDRLDLFFADSARADGPGWLELDLAEALRP